MTHAATQPLPAAAAADDVAPLIDRNLSCVRCEYNLRGLTAGVAAACPECGEPVTASLTAERLNFASADARWLRRVRRGIAALALSSLAGAATTLVCVHSIPWLKALFLAHPAPLRLGVVAAVSFSMGTHWGRPSAWAEFALVALTAALAIAGTWLLTSPPPWPEPLPVARGRRALRGLATLAALILAALLSTPFLYMTWAWGGWGPLRRAAQAPLWAIEVPQVLLLLGYLRHLARRTPDRRLPKLFRRLTAVAGLHVAVLALPQIVGVTLRVVIGVAPPPWLAAGEAVVLLTPPVTVALAFALYRLDRAAARALRDEPLRVAAEGAPRRR